MAEFNTIKYNGPENGVARIVLARLAAQDDEVKVIVLAGEGPDFSSGHAGLGNLDLNTYEPSDTWSVKGFKDKGQEGQWGAEQEFFLGFCWRWRNIPKPTIAEVQGWVIAGGLMLMWPSDLIVAAENAKFTDPVVAFGVNAVEYCAHPWEMGVRKARWTNSPLSLPNWQNGSRNDPAWV